MANINQKLAVLIDADNAQASVIQELLAEVSRYGTATIKRAYGDWTTTNLKGWKEVLHTGRVDGFCLVSSDSDFTRLATRIREAGLVVYGFGERKTPEPFVAACDKFVYTEILRIKPEEPKVEVTSLGSNLKSLVEVAELPELRPMIVTAVDAVARDDGWAPLGPVGSQMNKNNPSFDPRNYGFAQLSKLIRKQDYLEIKEVPMGDGSTNVHLYVRYKSVAPSKAG
jgi:uncharacterized LabA/DUF88 family protein